MSDAARLANEKGFHVVNLVYEKAVGNSILFQISALGEEVSVERRELLLRGPAQKDTVQLTTLMNERSCYKGSPSPCCWMKQRWR